MLVMTGPKVHSFTADCICLCGVLPTWAQFKILSCKLWEPHRNCELHSNSREGSFVVKDRQRSLSFPSHPGGPSTRHVSPPSPSARQTVAFSPLGVLPLESVAPGQNLWSRTHTVSRSQSFSTIHTQSFKFKLWETSNRKIS